MLSADAPVLVRVVTKVRCWGLFGAIFNLPKIKLGGISLTVPAVRVIVAAADLVPSVTEVAVRVTVALVGTVLGAAYVVGVPLAVSAGVIVPQAGEHAVPF
jgi:hypothetical protein